MAGRLDRLQEWLARVDFLSTQVIIIHDKRDEDTSNELISITTGINASGLILKEGIFGTAAGARNFALSSCEGEWICFWDSDDQPNYELVSSGLDSSYDVIIGEFSIETPNGLISKVLHGTDDENSLTRVSFNPGLWRMAFRARAIKDITFPEIAMGEDQCFLAQLDWSSLKTKFSYGVFYNYFSGWENQSTGRKKSRLPLIESLRYLRQLLKTGKGKEEFTRNIAARQFLTLIKSREFKAQRLAIIELIKLLCLNFGFLNQMKSFRSLASYLLRSALR
jgi:hypothetical protein